MHDHTLHRGRKYFAITVYKIFRNIKRSCYNDCFKINGKQTIKMPEKSEHVKIQKL